MPPELNTDIIPSIRSPLTSYCYSIEMKRALERRARGEAEVIPVILRPVYWHGEPLGKLQALPTDGKPVTDPDWHNLDRAFYDVATGIRKTAKIHWFKWLALIHTLQGHASAVLSVVISPDGQSIISGSDDQTIRCGVSPQARNCVLLLAIQVQFGV